MSLRRNFLILLLSLAFGSAVTLISGFYRQELSVLGRTNIGYGLPLSWHGISGPVVYPEIPTVDWFSWESFAFDIAFWSLIIGVIIAIAFRRFKARE